MPDKPPQGIICYWCKAVYNCRPSEHICPDGTTYKDRIANRKVGGDTYHYGDDSEVDEFHWKLTADDKKLLKGMKIALD